ncbi:B-box zinc finger protein [Pseudacidobacterium ailaaui]|uniref:B-box zinc finger protein n=1 Tax=Pseudacidobacterium ailaaui TaxID=1382359 RepID=UPI00047A45C0|nr:B-box zinc finger protein [Pseudacidobacterium ailaaui]MBX6360181.1 B-box zinc finger protein [Pseudacidobacterium ailaaui]MCL6463453.1 B-box zinc finger protein [Pseudacidobacterium ailaaui]MDI3253633.1 B-box zinc finger protein [Bacillota bacterium]
MNCANHPEIPVAAYCQNCGKPLCSSCVRQVSGVIYCEPCLAAKLGIGGTNYSFTGTAPGGVNYNISGTAPAASGADLPNPGLAALLGFIPGVGAMYNGQFIKALIHVLVFVVLVGISSEHGIFGIFIAAWVFYQVFDAHQTAKARRDGLPLPDPFGLNELGQKMGIPNRNWPPSASPSTDAAQAAGVVPPVPPPPGYEPVPPIPPVPGDPSCCGPLGRRPEPVGAIVLIAAGMLFLFSTLGILRFDWVGRGWPIIVIAVGAWLLFRHMRESGGTQ